MPVDRCLERLEIIFREKDCDGKEVPALEVLGVNDLANTFVRFVTGVMNVCKSRVILKEILILFLYQISSVNCRSYEAVTDG